ncbi:Rpn family recombination-promoting nuclease/putative transposase [Tindallia californiensis]|uniref:Transposase (putative) YhgA-like domain-containing protein n=1 Tax=Tindallia californiensis TaxID=159292 RepID=A0A1H3RF78_9FIRM|nr:Rpn family recombination-promoting nuclease/putative transposase [Tindallia californiensis]SDZ24492.1 conserved hypothetical protein (putative transposase or invertase) [Tindallia californiensis]
MDHNVVKNPHDTFFKENFSRTDVAHSFLTYYLPEDVLSQIDLTSLNPEKDRFINKSLKESHSDMLYSTRINGQDGYIYFLFEHKSYVEKDTLFQLMSYMTDIWRADMKQDIKELPVIIPLVIYCGASTWQAKTRLGDMIAGYHALPETIKKYVPDYEYPFYDLSHYSVDEMKGSARFQIMTSAFQSVFRRQQKHRDSRDVILRAGEHLRQMENQEDAMDCFETLLRYLNNEGKPMNRQEMEAIAEQLKGIYAKGSEVMKSTADLLREEGIQLGEARGEARGIQRGKQEEKANTLIKQLTKRFHVLPEEIKERIRQLDTDTLDLMLIEIFDYQSVDDVKKWLH